MSHNNFCPCCGKPLTQGNYPQFPVMPTPFYPSWQYYPNQWNITCNSPTTNSSSGEVK